MALRWNRQLVIDYQKVFNTPEGQRVLDDLRHRCPFLTDSIATSGGIDVHKLLYFEGQRSVLLHIYKQLHRDPNAERPDRVINRGESHA